MDPKDSILHLGSRSDLESALPKLERLRDYIANTSFKNHPSGGSSEISDFTTHVRSRVRAIFRAEFQEREELSNSADISWVIGFVMSGSQPDTSNDWKHVEEARKRLLLKIEILVDEITLSLQTLDRDGNNQKSKASRSSAMSDTNHVSQSTFNTLLWALGAIGGCAALFFSALWFYVVEPAITADSDRLTSMAETAISNALVKNSVAIQTGFEAITRKNRVVGGGKTTHEGYSEPFKPEGIYSRYVAFEKPIPKSSNPIVHLSLSALDIAHIGEEFDFSLHADLEPKQASATEYTGFNIKLRVANDFVVNSAQVNWVAIGGAVGEISYDMSAD